MTTIGIARSLVGAAMRHRTVERRFGDWTIFLDLAPTNWTIGLWIDGLPVVQFWLDPLGCGIARADQGDDRS